MPQPSRTASATVARVIRNGTMRLRRPAESRGFGSRDPVTSRSSPVPRFDVTSAGIFDATFMTASVRNDQGRGRENDDINGKHEQSRMPYVSQQTEAAGYPAQRDRDDPGCDHQQTYWGNVNAKQINFGEPHA